MAKKKTTRGVKSPALKVAEKKIEQLTGKLEAAEREVAEAQHSAKYWENRATDADVKRLNYVEQVAKEKGAREVCEAHRSGVLQTAMIHAHQELSGVKAAEGNAAALQRILGSVQGAIGVALKSNGNLEGGMISLYPDDENAKRTLDAVRNTISAHNRY